MCYYNLCLCILSFCEYDNLFLYSMIDRIYWCPWKSNMSYGTQIKLFIDFRCSRNILINVVIESGHCDYEMNVRWEKTISTAYENKLIASNCDTRAPTLVSGKICTINASPQVCVQMHHSTLKRNWAKPYESNGTDGKQMDRLSI